MLQMWVFGIRVILYGIGLFKEFIFYKIYIEFLQNPYYKRSPDICETPTMWITFNSNFFRKSNR